MGWVGMELVVAPGLLQSHHLGGMASPISSAELLVSSAPGPVQHEAGIWRQLALSPAELSSTPAASATG
jgi:hypothetical protein